jgi:hypothetical protein
MQRRTIEFIWIYLVASVFYGLFALMLAFPFHPVTVLGWFLWFLAALPVAMVGEAIGSITFNARIGKAIDPDTDRVSAGRVAYGVVAALLLMSMLLTIVWLLDLAWGDFWDSNFSSNW